MSKTKVETHKRNPTETLKTSKNYSKNKRPAHSPKVKTRTQSKQKLKNHWHKLTHKNQKQNRYTELKHTQGTLTQNQEQQQKQ